jgi:hypothetical protein
VKPCREPGRLCECVRKFFTKHLPSTGKKKPELMMPRYTAIRAALQRMVPRSKLAGADPEVQGLQCPSTPAGIITAADEERLKTV